MAGLYKTEKFISLSILIGYLNNHDIRPEHIIRIHHYESKGIWELLYFTEK